MGRFLSSIQALPPLLKGGEMSDETEANGAVGLYAKQNSIFRRHRDFLICNEVV